MALMKADGTVLVDDDMNLVVKAYYMTGVSLTANGSTTIEISGTAPMGYKQLGTVDVTSTNINVVCTNQWGMDPIKANLKNMSGSAVTTNISVKKLFMKAP